jgi:NitT/TauT family transport system permease protein
MRFWKLDVPFAMPGLVWNMMMSMSGSWFFVVASEAISVGDTKITLPGIGSYISLAIDQQNIGAIVWAVGAMAVVIGLYDQLVFRPVVAWSDKFRVDLSPRARQIPVLDLAGTIPLIGHFFGRCLQFCSGNVGSLSRKSRAPKVNKTTTKLFDSAWNAALLALAAWAAWLVVSYVRATLAGRSWEAVMDAFITFSAS